MAKGKQALNIAPDNDEIVKFVDRVQKAWEMVDRNTEVPTSETLD